MKTKYYLSVDGGGTKLHTLLFDEALRPVGSGISGAINPNFVPMEIIEQHMAESIDQALSSAAGQACAEIEDVWISMPGPADLYEKLLRRRCGVGGFHKLSEGETAIFSAGISTGLLVLCGTGGTLFYVRGDGDVLFQGGWGSPFGDEGSGADIGCMAMRAALRSYDGWGPKTALEPEICKFFGFDDLREAIMTWFWKQKDTRGIIASVCRLVGECARAGDQTACSILAEAGRKAAEQAMAFIHRERLPETGPVVLGGGAWKSGEIMIRSFVNTIASRYPEAKVMLPTFDPVVGPIVKMAMADDGTGVPEETMERLRQLYAPYVTQWPPVPEPPRSRAKEER